MLASNVCARQAIRQKTTFTLRSAGHNVLRQPRTTKGRGTFYYVEAGGTATRYSVGVGREGYGWRGTETVTAKRPGPDWRPPADMLARRPDLPTHMVGRPDNPLGARTLYLGNTLYRIHGSNECLRTRGGPTPASTSIAVPSMSAAFGNSPRDCRILRRLCVDVEAVLRSPAIAPFVTQTLYSIPLELRRAACDRDRLKADRTRKEIARIISAALLSRYHFEPLRHVSTSCHPNWEMAFEQQFGAGRDHPNFEAQRVAIALKEEEATWMSDELGAKPHYDAGPLYPLLRAPGLHQMGQLRLRRRPGGAELVLR